MSDLASLACLAAMVWAFRIGFRGYIASIAQVEREDLIVGAASGLACAVVFPVTLLFGAVWVAVRGIGDPGRVARAIGGETRRTRAERLAREDRTLRARIAELEGQLELQTHG